jgi:PAS domain S-box-containing protein
MALYATLPVSAAWLLGYPAALRAAGVCITSMLVYTVLEMTGATPPSTLTPTTLGLWFVAVQSTLIGTIPVGQVISRLMRTLKELEAHIDERKRTELALRESEVRFRTVAHTAPVMIVTSDANGQATFFNRAWSEFTGRPLAQDLGHGWVESLHPDDKDWCLERLASTFSSHKDCHMEYRLRRSDGEFRTLMCTGVPRYEPNGTFVGYIATLVDITEVRQNQERLRALSASVISAQEEERRRISRELHDDLIQRLGMIAIDLGSLTAEGVGADGAMNSKLRFLQRRVVETAELTRHIAHELHPFILDDLGIVEAVRSLCDEYTRREQIEIHFVNGPLPEILSRETASCIYAVAREALLNISKHSQAKQGDVSLVSNGGSVMLTVMDDGIGLPPGAENGNLGLGLVNMRERVRWVNGTLSLSSEFRRGTQVTIQIPVSGGKGESRSHSAG